MYSRANRAAALALAGMLAAGSVSDGINPVHTVQAAEQTKEVAVDAKGTRAYRRNKRRNKI